ncbi:hypothetical protein D3C77_724400 [compost metagenome]
MLLAQPATVLLLTPPLCWLLWREWRRLAQAKAPRHPRRPLVQVREEVMTR